MSTRTMPPTCKSVKLSFNTMTDTIIATGNSIALKIDTSPPPTLGAAMENNKIGKIIPNMPSAKPYFQSPAVSCPFQIISGDSKSEMMINDTIDTMKVRPIVVIPDTGRELICKNAAKLNAADKPSTQPCQAI